MTASPAAAMVRAWVDLYTRGMSGPVRDARRDEVADDLWCQREEALAIGRSPRSLEAEMLMRLLFGMPADISWRLSSGGPVRAPRFERRPSRGTLVLGILAVIGSASWAILIADYVLSGVPTGTGASAYIAFVLTVIGGLAYAGAATGLALRFQDRMTPVGAVAGVIAGVAALLGGLGGYQADILLPIGSAVMALDLGRVGVLSRLLAVSHAVTAAALLVLLWIALTYYPITGSLWLLALAGPYLISWLAIGISLIRGERFNREATRPRRPF
jgi:hypothetical protein